MCLNGIRVIYKLYVNVFIRLQQTADPTKTKQNRTFWESHAPYQNKINQIQEKWIAYFIIYTVVSQFSVPYKVRGTSKLFQLIITIYKFFPWSSFCRSKNSRTFENKVKIAATTSAKQQPNNKEKQQQIKWHGFCLFSHYYISCTRTAVLFLVFQTLTNISR